MDKEELKERIYKAIKKSDLINEEMPDTIWYDDFTTLYDQIGFIIDEELKKELKE